MKKLIIDENECIGCDVCVELCPRLFESTEFVPRVIVEDIVGSECATASIDFCPVAAISIVVT